MSILKSNEAYGSFKALGKDIWDSMFNPIERLQNNEKLGQSFANFVGEDPGFFKSMTGIARASLQNVNGEYSAPHIATMGALTFGKVGVTAAMGVMGVNAVTGDKEK